MKNRHRRAGIKQHWFKDDELRNIKEILSAHRQSFIVFQLLLLSGQKFARLNKTTWDDFNARLGVLTIHGRAYHLPPELTEALLELRDQATGENQLIITMKYKKFWERLARACLRIGLPELGVLVLRNTFAYKHFQTYQSKNRLKKDLGLSTIRYLPKQIFTVRPVQPSLFQGVL